MKLNDDELQRLYREGTRREGREDCPDAAQFERGVQGNLKPEERETLADHIATCADCAEEYRLAAELQRGAPRKAASRAPRWLGLAASLLLISTASVVWWVAQDDPSSTHRGETAARAGVSPAHDAVVDQAPKRLSWTGEPDAVYRVELYDVESVPIWTGARTGESFVELPAEVRQRLAPGGVYYWRVFTEKQVERARSDLYRFTLAP